MRRILICSIVVATAGAAACRFDPPGLADDGGGDGGTGGDGGVASTCDVAPTWEAGLQPARTIYVAPTAGSGGPLGSQTNPYTALSAALVAAKTAGPGTKVSLASGMYSVGATIMDLRGTATAPFWIEGPASGGRAQLMGGTASLHLIRPQYVVVRHLDISNTTFAAFNADDGAPGGVADHLVIDDVTISSTGATAFQITGLTDVAIKNSTATTCNRAVMMVGVRRASIARLQASSLTFAGVLAAGGSQDIEVRQSRFANMGTGIRIGGDSDANEFRPALGNPSTGNFEAADVRVFNNVFAGGFTDVVSCINCVRALVAHNEIRGVNGSVFFLEQAYVTHPQLPGAGFARAGQVQWINNAIEVPGSPAGMQMLPTTGNTPDAASCSFRRNLWSHPPGTTWMPVFPAPVTESMGIYNQPSGYDDNGKLCGGGAAGTGVVVPEVTGTLSGMCRPAPPALPSIGPSERDPGC